MISSNQPIESRDDRPHPRLWLEICALLAGAQVLLAGYTFDVGNQAIQISFLKRILDPGLFPHDLLMTTIPEYPTFFFRGLALFLPDQSWIEVSYLFLHLITAFAMMAAVWTLAFSIFRNQATAFFSCLLLVAGNLVGLSESDLYSPGFTHTWAALPIAIFSIAMLFSGRPVAAFALGGFLANIHALTACYVGAILVLWAVCNARRAGLVRTTLFLGLLALLGMPTWVRLAVGPMSWDATWLKLLWIRSSHHVLLADQWAAGHDQIPRFLLVSTLSLLCLAATPPGRESTKTLAIAVSTLVALVLTGVLVGEVLPMAPALRAQLLRSSRLLLLLLLPAVAHCLVVAVQSIRRDGALRERVWATPEAILAVFIFAAIAVPALASTQFAVLAVGAILFAARGRLPWSAALLTGAVVLICVIAYGRIGFALWDVRLAAMSRADFLFGAVGLGGAVLLTMADSRSRSTTTDLAIRAAGVCLFGVLAWQVFARAQDARVRPDSWRQVQEAANQYTERDGVILTPVMQGGFRLHSNRSIVGEWRDGTQQFFSPAFAEAWWQRMQDLRPGLRYDDTGHRVLSRGVEIGDLPDVRIAELWKKYHADYVVLPAVRSRSLPVVYRNADWMLCRAELIPPPPPPPPPAGVTNAVEWQAQERFMQDVVRPNIEKYRKSDATVQVLDAQGHPARGATFEINQVSSPFRFSCVLPHFSNPPAPADFQMPIVNSEELARFREVFNWSVIGYSGKWNVMEPEEGKPSFDHLDRYVDWCSTNNIGLEYHFVSGYEPNWLKTKSPEEKQRLFLEHAELLMKRYGDRIRTWQVVNESHLLRQAPEVFKLMRRLDPTAVFGIGDCARFYSDRTGPQRVRDMCRGMDDVKWLVSKGCKVDFFALHGHRPFGLWADVREMYSVMDAFQKEGLRIHISEFGKHENLPIVGNVRTGRWNRDLQAEYYRRYYTVCFSHPAVDEVNLWGMGPVTWMTGSGLLDAKYNPKPSFDALKKLITVEWRTSLCGEVGLDGMIRFRGFHGAYDVVLRAPDGRESTHRFEIAPNRANRIVIRTGAGQTQSEKP